MARIFTEDFEGGLFGDLSASAEGDFKEWLDSHAPGVYEITRNDDHTVTVLRHLDHRTYRLVFDSGDEGFTVPMDKETWAAAEDITPKPH